ncbi:molybdopterin-dependent oxidoreductase [Falsiroseomonas oryziterrae]|uniref:molybdopterin-dependent oxidoreductase n=1 Tax=Falsiroseomonas oryziterrae TaxID=2911368 RepID=UPI001F28998F|nr:molybdopterin-dependent oxidoreductase [Roseomonas sp. NPKOSM-4]
MQRRSLLAATAAGLSLPAPRPAAADERIVLSVTGAVARAAEFTLAGLEALGQVELRTRTAWTGPALRHFAGVPLARLLDQVGARGTVLHAVALNDYAISAPIPELLRHEAFLAMREDGAPMRIRDRGPVWLIFPWSQRPELDVPTVRERAIWQLRRIEIR